MPARTRFAKSEPVVRHAPAGSRCSLSSLVISGGGLAAPSPGFATEKRRTSREAPHATVRVLSPGVTGTIWMKAPVRCTDVVMPFT